MSKSKQKSPKKTIVGKVADELANAKVKASQALQNKAAYKTAKGKAKAAKIKAKADLIEARQGAAKTRARAAAVASIGASFSASRQNANASQAMKEWTDVINSNSQPAEGTGDPSMGSTTDGQTSDMPLGNYRKQ